MDIFNLTWDQRKLIAISHDKKVREEYPEDIKHCIEHTYIHSDIEDFTNVQKRFPKTEIKMRPIGTEVAVDKMERNNDKIAVLNFSDYKFPGGKFLDGSKAQEECLCHNSILFPVLDDFTYKFYAPNVRSLNGGMYTNKMLYSEDVLFFCPGGDRKVDVITCAAPNFINGKRYGTISKEECDRVMNSRLEFIFKAALHHHVDVLILGAYGCGVFKNDPTWVAQCIRRYAEFYDGCFKKIILPIPDKGSVNYYRFKEVFENCPLIDSYPI